MKLHSDSSDSTLRVTAYDARGIAIGERRVTTTCLITPEILLVDLPDVDVLGLRWETLNALHGLELEVLLIGTGSIQQFPQAELYAELSSRRIGLEVMTTPAACRTFNILAAEYRRVAALLTFDHG